MHYAIWYDDFTATLSSMALQSSRKRAKNILEHVTRFTVFSIGVTKSIFSAFNFSFIGIANTRTVCFEIRKKNAIAGEVDAFIASKTG